MIKSIALTTFSCLHVLLSPPSINPVLASSALTNYPARENENSRMEPLHAPAAKAASAIKAAVPKVVRPQPVPVGNRLSPAFDKLLLGDLTLKTGVLGPSPGDQALILSNTYIDAVIRDETRSRPVQHVRATVVELRGRYFVTGHFDGHALKAQLNPRNLDHMFLDISVREYEWFGHGDRLGTLSLKLRSLLEQLSASSPAVIEFKTTDTKVEIEFESPGPLKTK